MKFILIVLSALLFCCTSKNESRENLKAKYFRNSFIKKFKVISRPCSVEHQPDSSYELVSFNEASLDTLIINGPGLRFYGMLADTATFFTTIMYAPAAQLIPAIVTFDKTGNQISATSIDFGCWDGGPYDYTCSGGFVINPDMSISLNHETIVTKSYGSDSTEVFPWKDTHNWKGRILKNGVVKIEGRPQ